MNIYSKRVALLRARLISVLIYSGILSLLLLTFSFVPQTDNLSVTANKKTDVVTIPFIANHGQVDSSVAYYAPTFASTLFVTHQGEMVYSLPAKLDKNNNPGWTLVETLVGGKVKPVGKQTSSTQVSYFLGDDPKKWLSDLPTYQSVSLGEVWPGIELNLAAHGNSVEKIFTVKPGSDINDIQLQVNGASALIHGNKDNLIATTAYGEVSFSAPVAWQQDVTERKPVQVAYVLTDQGYGFNLGQHDPSLAVIIDPVLQATYLGGSASDTAWGLAIHVTSNDLLVAGDTKSLDFPGTTGGAQAVANVNTPNAFIARISADLKNLHQVTYLGGSGAEYGTALAIHPSSSQVYISGLTSSSDFPETAGGAQPISDGSQNAYVARLSTNLKTLYQSTYLGGDDTDQAWAMNIHPITGEIYIFGETRSENFPNTIGGVQPVKDDYRDTFIARLSADLETLHQATYLGAGGNDSGLGITFNPTSGDVYVTGLVGYALNDLPGVSGGAQATRTSDDDEAFVSRLSADLGTLYQSTYFGGSRNEVGYNVAIDPASDNVYISGYTRSDDLPGTTGGAQQDYGTGISGFDDAFVASFDKELTTLNQSTYLGGNNSEQARDIAVHPVSGEIYVSGSTLTIDFPGTTGGAQPDKGGLYDTFVSRLSPDLQTLHQSTYVGGSGYEYTYSLLLHPVSGDVYVAGETTSDSDYPAVSGGAQSTHNGGSYDVFIAQLDASLSGTDTTPDAFSFNDQTDVALNTLITSNTITVSGIDDSTAISISGGEYSIDGGAYTSATGSVINGQAVTLQVTSSGSFNFDTEATLTIGGVSDTFSVTTLVNNPPSAPVLVAPLDNSVDIDGSSITFEWEPSVDPDGDAVSYQLYYCSNDSFTGCSAVDVAWYQKPESYLAMVGGTGVLMLSVFSTTTGRRRRLMQASALILASLLFNACGGGSSKDNDDDPVNITHSVTNLTAGTTYYWKIVALDNKGGKSESSVWSFTTR